MELYFIQIIRDVRLDCSFAFRFEGQCSSIRFKFNSEVVVVSKESNQQQTARANGMASLKSLNKLANTRVFIAAEKWMVRSTGVGGLISLQNGNLRR